MRTGVLPASILLICLGVTANAANPILGEIEIEAASRTERNAGVWVDGQYVGYIKNLQGSGKLVLVPGEHLLEIKLIGYEDIESSITVEPGQEMRYRVSMRPADDAEYPDEAETAKLRVLVEPEEAAIFIDGAYVGHVDRFNGRRGMRLASGTYRFTIALPGYVPFETELTLNAGQDYEIKTELPKGDANGEADALISGRIAAR